MTLSLRVSGISLPDVTEQVQGHFWPSHLLKSGERSHEYKTPKGLKHPKYDPREEMSLRGYIRLVDLEICLKHHKVYISKLPPQTFSWWKESVWKEICSWVGRNGIFGEAGSEKVNFQDCNFTAMDVSGTLHSSTGNLSVFLAPSTCTKQEPPFSKALLPWKHFPPLPLCSWQEHHFSPLFSSPSPWPPCPRGDLPADIAF